MAVPQVTDFTLFAATALTGANWNTNCTQIVTYLTDGNYDFTVNKVTTTANIVVGTNLTVGGTITPTGNYLGTGKIPTATIANGAVTPVKMTRNIESTVLSDDYQMNNSLAYVARTGATVTLTGVRASGSARVSIRSTWQILYNGTGTIAGGNGRINIDSGSAYVYLGAISFTMSSVASPMIVGFLGGDTLVTGLSAGDHTFTLEVKTATASDVLTNYIATSPASYCCELIAEEV